MLLFVTAIMPPEQKLKLGKDLRGGVSLVYSVQIARSEDAKDVLAKTIDVLKKRVDPDGLYEISMVAQGRDRIEISMPLPGPEVKELRKKFDAELAKLATTAIPEGKIEQLGRAQGAAREAMIAELAAEDSTRRALLVGAMKAYDAATLAREQLSAAQKAGAAQADIDALVSAAADADIKYEEAKRAVSKAVLSPEEVRRALALSNRARILTDDSTAKREVIELPSPREEALKRIRTEHPDASGQLDRVLEAYNAYATKRRTLDDPQDLVRLLRAAGVLTFRITVKPDWDAAEIMRLRQELREHGPQAVRSTEMHWYKINQIDRMHGNTRSEVEAMQRDPASFFKARGWVVDTFDGEFYMLCWDVRNSRLTNGEGQWSVAKARPGVDQFGKPSIEFEMDPKGAVLLGELTKQHVQEPMAILLDDEVYTAPTLQSAISARGQITGNFSQDEINYVVRVLSAGSLQSKLSPEPISTNSLGPELGADNLRQGFKAGVAALIVVSVFMLVYYFSSGAIAIVALLCNAVIILGAMSLAKAAFTMPGIAGIILTFGQAVDANVLIYERMREEIRRGADLKTAVRLGYSKALSSIVDGNVTNLIVCVVLGYTGTQEVRGFAITMGIGIVATLFCALVVSRVIFDVLVHYVGWRKVLMLPMVLPGLQRLLTPNINWLRLRFVFIGISAAYVGLGLFMVATRGERMLDTEFRGGTQVTLQFKKGPGGEAMTLTRLDAERRVQQLAEGRPATDPLSTLASAEVSPVNPRDDGVTSDQFIVKTVATDKEAVTNALTSAFSELLETRPPLTFNGSEQALARQAPIYQILSSRLGNDIDRSDVGDDVASYVGGAAIVMADLKNSLTGQHPTLESIRQRLELMRSAPDFSDTLNRQRDIRVIDGNDREVRTAVLLVNDPAMSFLANQARFDSEIVEREWKLVTEALTRATSPASVQSFSPAIADTFKAQAIVATLVSFGLISVYIWIRFKSGRYGLAAIVALLHDVFTVLGLIALCEVLYEYPSTEGFARSLGLLPFKIDLNMVAAILTVSGYSLNDTIIIMDRIRELRGKLPYATRKHVNDAINQTISRTIITSGTTLISVMVLYLYGGEGVREFAYVMLCGLIVGTYSSIAVAAPLVWVRSADPHADKPASGAQAPVTGGSAATA